MVVVHCFIKFNLFMGMCENLYGTLTGCNCMPFASLVGLWRATNGTVTQKGQDRNATLLKHCPLKWGTPIISMHEGSTLFIIVN